MNKKILIGLSVFGMATGFWACGDGEIITKGDDEVNAATTDENMISQMKDKAIADCLEDPACEAKMNAAENVPEPESSDDGGNTPTPGGDDEGGNGGNGGNGGGPVPTTSSSKPTVPSGSSTGSADSGSSDQPPPSSASTVTDSSVPDGTCNGSTKAITKGGQVTWTFTAASLDLASLDGNLTDKLAQQNAYTKMVNESTCEWTIQGAATTSVSGPCGGDGKTVTATYAAIGNYTTSIKLGEKTIDCGTVAVEGPAVTGCTCAVDEANPDVKNGDVTVTWTVSGCKAGTDTPDANWTYTWTGATSSSPTATATVSKKGDTKSASVKVTSAENASMSVTCPTVKAINSDLPDYEIGGTGITVPNGACGVATTSGQLRIEHAYVGSSCTVGLTIAGKEYAAETRSDCNIYYGVLSFDGTNVSSGQQICVTATGSASDVTLKIQ